MKLSGVTKMVKRQLVCNVFHNIKSDDFYIGTASAIYCATGFPLPLNEYAEATLQELVAMLAETHTGEQEEHEQTFDNLTDEAEDEADDEKA